MYLLIPAEQGERYLLFLLEGESAECYSQIGYFRADFGKNGTEFWSSWFDGDKRLKTKSFQSEFDDIINQLRTTWPNPPFANRKALAAYVDSSPGLTLGGRGEGYKLQTQDFTYYIRCLPTCGDYEIYIFAYDSSYLQAELSGQHDLPIGCYSILPSSGELISIRKDERGYHSVEDSTPDREKNRQIANEINTNLRITRKQEEALLAACLFGLKTSAAKP